jgi:hypothetical protein
LVNRNENLNRTKNGQNALKGNGTESQSLSDLPIRKKRALIRDSYGCVNWGPSVSNDQEEEQDRQRIELKQWYGQENPDWDKVYSAMEATFPLQRKHINGGALLGQLFSDWPFLLEQHVLLAHCKQLLGKDLRQAIDASFLKKAPRMLRFFKCRKTKLQPYIMAAEQQKQQDNVQAILPLVILCLQSTLEESEGSLFVVVVDVSL